MSEPSWDDLADMAERGELRPVPGTALYDLEAQHAGRRALLNATGADTIEEATRLALGRPKLGEDRDTRMWRVRATPVLDDTVGRLAEREGRSRSDIIRAAVAEYAAARGA